MTRGVNAEGDEPFFLFAHGAGAPSSSGWMIDWKKRLATLGPTVTFDYAYIRERRRMPDRLPQLIATHRAEIDAAAKEHRGHLVLAGKSMGSRVGCHVSLEEPSVRALICFGYPLQGAGKQKAIRDEVLLALTTPILFLQGTRDPLCPIEMLESVRAKMQARSVLHLVEGGDHSLKVSAAELRRTVRTQADSDAEVLRVIAQFLKTIVSSDSRS